MTSSNSWGDGSEPTASAGVERARNNQGDIVRETLSVTAGNDVRPCRFFGLSDGFLRAVR